jgi:DNA sulfur modification protein DndD
MAKVTFNNVAVENLGPFRERQDLDLRVRRSRPVILIKALNGSGKTTLLTCLQVVLYGSKVFSGKSGEYEQLIRGLQRADATGRSKISLELTIETSGEREQLTVVREWAPNSARLNERLEVLRDAIPDLHLTEDWPDFIDNILPSELLQLFLFDGEKIEALANPRSLPEMLRRATEAFLGIGGIDALSRDLIAVERRALLHAKSVDADYVAAREELEQFQRDLDQTEERIAMHAHRKTDAQKKLIKAAKELETFKSSAARQGLAAYEQAADIRAAEQLLKEQLGSAEEEVRLALADPFLPLARIGPLWDAYKLQWSSEEEGQTAKAVFAELKRRDARVLKAIEGVVGPKAIDLLKSTLQQENSKYVKASKSDRHLRAAPSPEEVERQIRSAMEHHQLATLRLDETRERLHEAERRLAAVPSKDQVADVLENLREKTAAVTRAEAESELIEAHHQEERGRAAHLKLRVDAATNRMRDDFKGKELDGRAIEAAQRTRLVLRTFKDRLLASKAAWLSEMITAEFQSLLRKQRLIERVEVAADTYVVRIVSRGGEILPMERLSAGERQLLAIAVLSALIRERKGLFPVVVDTPLARLDRTHRQALIQRFFAKISHQVLVLSTDEEVEGTVLDAMRRHTSTSYVIQFADEEHRSVVEPATVDQVFLEAA